MMAELPTVGFLVAAGREVGGGHLMRCLSIARALGTLGVRVYFFSGELPAPLAARCVAQGIRMETVSPLGVEQVGRHASRAGLNLLVVDGYRFDEPWRKHLKRDGRKLVVMDDLNDPPVNTADAIINASPDAGRLGYNHTAPQAQQWLGPEFAPLAPEFAQPVTLAPELRNGLLVSFGASDPVGYTVPLLQALLATLPAMPPSPVRVVTGPAMDSGQLNQVRSLVASHPSFEHHHDCHDMRALMRRSGLAVSAVGGTLYELAACGVPTVAVAVSPNQQHLAVTLESQAGWCRIMHLAPPQARELAQATWRCWSDLPWRLTAMDEARRWLDGKGSQRLAERILMIAEQGANP